MPLETDSLEYIDHGSALYQDTRRFEQAIAGLDVTEVWLRGRPGTVTDPDVLAGYVASVADIYQSETTRSWPDVVADVLRPTRERTKSKARATRPRGASSRASSP